MPWDKSELWVGYISDNGYAHLILKLHSSYSSSYTLYTTWINFLSYYLLICILLYLCISLLLANMIFNIFFPFPFFHCVCFLFSYLILVTL